MNEYIEKVILIMGESIGFCVIIFTVILMTILLISYIKLLKKASVSVGNVFWFFLPLIGSFILALKLDPVKKFGKGSSYLIGIILLPIIFVPLLAFSDNVDINNENLDINNSSNNVDNTVVSNNNLIDNKIDVSEIRAVPDESQINVETVMPVVDVESVQDMDKISNVSAISTISVADLINALQTDGIKKNKTCKNCGNKLPNIVSICPNCSTDNE